jgi:asparagine synthase (glutamine-hydrolysing)
MGALIAVLHKQGEDATKAAVTMLKALRTRKTEAFGIASPTATHIESKLETLGTEALNSITIVGHAFTKILASDKPQPMRLEKAALVFEGRIYSSTINAADTENIVHRFQQENEKAAETSIKVTDADFAFAIAEPSRLIAGKDAIGARPLYFGQNSELTALASERKALWSIGINHTEAFPLGHIAIVDKNGFSFKHVKTLEHPKLKQTSLQAASEELQALLERSVEERIRGLKEATVAFSGGLDSSLIAFLAKKSKAHIELVHVSLENQPETEHAKTAAKELGLPIRIRLFKENDVERVLPEVLWLIEEPDPVKAGIGVPMYWAAQEAAEMKLKVMLAGQGADELFGGYKRYVDEYLRDGSEKARKQMFNDVVRLHETNIDRDSKICNSHGVELRLPFAAYEVARFALSLPTEHKIEPKHGGTRKLILRHVAKRLGLPRSIAEKPKKAVQYTTGVDKALKKLAKKNKSSLKEYLQHTFADTARKMT